ncbi:hypothetical protein ACFOEK_19670 [Litoribrevibacter euphylliae]|uniref:Uncharacterized protein n=1 Tax=Litoribrevibacter euphylliae TaxID=1834034 RepID=A0ABV7HKQ7_9GAMM
MRSDFEKLLALDFEALVAAHGMCLESGAKDALRREVQNTFKE